MYNSLSTYLENFTKHDLPPFSLEDISDFPYNEFNANKTRYTELEQWYSGDALEAEVVSETGNIETYPVRINPIRNQVHKHAHFLFGEVKQDDRPLVYPRVLPSGDTDNDRLMADQAQEALMQVWWENNGRALQWQNGATCQIYGGCIFELSWDTLDQLRTIPIRIEIPHPKYFVGKPSASNPWRLEEAWIVNLITRREAAENGVLVEEDSAWLVKHYTPLRYDVTVNGQPASRQLSDGSWFTISGANEWGFVPIVYIPHIRAVGFYGENDIDGVIGIIKEYNLRVADYGDAVNVDSHAYVAMRHVSGAPEVQHLAPNLNVINLQSTPSVTGMTEPDPDMFDIRKPSASAPMKDLVLVLYDIYRRLSSMPAVVDGEDEGSQRSGLTLAMRMLSLTAHTDTERVFWSTGLDLLNRMILRMLMIKGEAGITAKHATLRIKEDWSPVLPRDREMVVQEAVALIAAKLGSPERLLEILGVDDVGEERELILKFWEEIAEIESEAAAKNQPPTAGVGSSPGKGGSSMKPVSKANSAQENHSTE